MTPSSDINNASNTNEPMTGFEGPEKLLEIWFKPIVSSAAKTSTFHQTPTHHLSTTTAHTSSTTLSTLADCNHVNAHSADNDDDRTGLRRVSYESWVSMLKLVKCEILSSISRDGVDAFLLSESSMFVYPYKLILKTCGTTTLLMCLDRLLQLARDEAGLTGEIDYIFYSRKSFMFPERQLFPHTGWKDEVDWLDRYFDGSAYVVGKMNSDHWYVYLWEDPSPSSPRPTLATPPPSPLIGTRSTTASNLDQYDQTLEILMTDLDPSILNIFYQGSALDADGNAYVTKALQEIYPDAQIDDFLFTPCGYSCNALSPHGYFTVHVTPEQHCSYASFETNIVAAMDDPVSPDSSVLSYAQICKKIIDIFKPGHVTVTLFSEKDDQRRAIDVKRVGRSSSRSSASSSSSSNRFSSSSSIMWPWSIELADKNYVREDRILYEFGNYELAFFGFNLSGRSTKSRRHKLLAHTE